MAATNLPVIPEPDVLHFSEPSSNIDNGPRLFTSIGEGGAYNGSQVDTGSEGLLVSRSLMGKVEETTNTFTVKLWPSGLTYTGKWVRAAVSFSSKHLDKYAPGDVSTVTMSIKAVDRIVQDGRVLPNTSTCLLGVGFDKTIYNADYKGPLDINPFLLTPLMVANIFRPGYILDWQSRTVTLGITDKNSLGFKPIPLVRAGNHWDVPLVNIDLPDSKIHIEGAGFLMDTGITGASIVAPKGVDPPLDSNQLLANGQRVIVSSPEINHPLFSFTTGEASTDAPAPGVHWGNLETAVPPGINTGFHALEQFKYMYDAGNGVMGFKFVQ